MYIDEETEKEMMLMDIPLTEELKKKNPELYDRIVALRSNFEDAELRRIEKFERE